MGWKITELDNGEVHVHPIDDLAEHSLSLDCWCAPTEDEEDGAIIIVHNSKDGREHIESGRRKPS